MYKNELPDVPTDTPTAPRAAGAAFHRPPFLAKRRPRVLAWTALGATFGLAMAMMSSAPGLEQGLLEQGMDVVRESDTSGKLAA